jgi:hypothetical protein
MRTSWLKLYGPFLGLALVQALFIAVAPSLPSNDDVVAQGPLAGGLLPSDQEGVFVDPETGELVDAEGNVIGQSSSGSGSRSGARGAAVGSAGGATGGGGAAAQAGDTSHCKGDRQFDILHANPPCAAKWTGEDNGGSTFQGVTKDEVKIVFFGSEPNAAVDAILAQQGLARTDEDETELFAAATDFVNKNYELYGRKIKIVERDHDGCPQTPPNPPACIEAARRVVAEEKPFMVLWDSGLYPTVFNEFGRLGVVTIGGWHFSEEYFTDFRPFRYDVFMDGTKSVRMLAEYYCKNLAGKNATHTGPKIHNSIGFRGQVPRRLGISVPDVDANVRTANLLASLVQKCDPGVEPPVVKAYQSNIETASQQADATAAAYIDAGVTTITCLCDPIAPAFGTRAYTKNDYYPEHLMAGVGLLDFDKLGRLYEPSQWTHAFGPSHLQVQPAHADSDASRMWRATGRGGTPCESCNLPWAYVALAASFIQGSGPNLHPVNIERAAQTSPGIGGWERTGGNPHVVRVSFAPGDYTGIDDVKEVYWSETTPSTIDGNPPSYINIAGGRRYEEGAIPGGFESRVPVKTQ